MTGTFRIVLLVSLFAFAGLLQAQESCSNGDMKGDFATQPKGILTIGPFAGPFAATGIIHFDGVGRFEGVATSSFNGSVIFPFDAVGTYSVTPDCFVTIFEETLRIGFEGFLSQTKNEVPLFQPQDTTITTNVLRRLSVSSCANANLRENWVIQASGSNIITSGSFAQIGAIRFDGQGNVAGTTRSSVNGVIVHRAVSGTYTVREDCTFSVRLTDENGILTHFFGTFFDDGSQFIFIYSDDGGVITGVAEQRASQTPCSNADLRGDFSTQPIGILTFGPFAGPFSAAGLVHFDGAGRFAGFATSSFNGTIFPSDAFGTYTVTPDCFVSTFEEVLQIPFEGYLSKTQNEVYLFQSQESTITTNVLHRLQISSCTNLNLRDNWILQASGSNIITSGSFAQIERLRFDGVGNVTGRTASSLHGMIVRNTVTGTYRMNGDCTFTARFIDENNQLSNFYSTMFGDGSKFIFIYSNTGLVITGIARRGAGSEFTGPPLINFGGVVNNASYTPAPSAVAPGSIAAIFGINLTDGTSCLPPSCNPVFGSNGRLNTTMSGAQVTVDGTPVPIFYASPGQLGIQMPAELTGGEATIQVAVEGQNSPPLTVSAEPVSPGIFAFTADGRGAGAITHTDGSPVSAQNPAHPGELVILYATGLGQVSPAVATGAIPTGLSRTVRVATVVFDGISVIPEFAGLAGCCVGLNQVNVRVPESTRSANDIPVVLTIGGKESNAVTVAVQRP